MSEPGPPSNVRARAAGDDVVAGAAVDPVVAGAAEQRVVAAEAEDHVVVAAAGEILALARTDDAAAATCGGAETGSVGSDWTTSCRRRSWR